MSQDISSLLLQSLASGAGPGPATEAILAQLGDEDPTMSAIVKYLAQPQPEQEQRQSGEESPAPEMSRAIQVLRRKVDQMFAELEELRGRNDTLAAALGACHLCWGEDLHCPVCRGKGYPGFSMPDKELFLELVTPAVRKLKGKEHPFSRNKNSDSVLNNENPDERRE